LISIEKCNLIDFFLNQDLKSEFVAQGTGEFNVFFVSKFVIKESVRPIKSNFVKSISEEQYTKNGYGRPHKGNGKTW